MKIGLHYSFQAPQGNSSALIEKGLEDIAAADEAGFSSAVFAEHHFHEDGWLGQPMMLAAAAAAVTKRMRVGSDIVVLPLHHPVAVAEEAALVDVLSGGRAILGLGLGWKKEEFAGFGVPWKPREQIYERSIDVVRTLLRGETVDSHPDEEHYRFSGARIRPLPVNPDGVPVWIGALFDRGVKRAARMADAWVMPPGNRVEQLREQKRLYDETREEAGLPPAKERPLRREAFVAETDEEAWELFAPGLRHEFGYYYRPLHPTYPDNDTVDELRRWGEGMWVVGSPATVAAEFRALEEELGVTEFLVRFELPGVPREAVEQCLEGFREVLSLDRSTASTSK